MRVDTDIIIVVDGEQYLVSEVDAKCDLVENNDGEPKVLETIHVGSDYYTGPTTIIPSQERQILSTTHKTIAENIIVEPIPPNYGLITWDGQKITVS